MVTFRALLLEVNVIAIRKSSSVAVKQTNR